MDDIRTRTEKRCPRCGLVKPVTEFYKNKAEGDGKTTYCKECSKQYTREFKDGLARRDDSNCGTPLGWKIHKAKGETPCDLCANERRSPDRRWEPSEKWVPPEHGTLRGYRLHTDLNETPCEPCASFANAYHKGVIYGISTEACVMLVAQFGGKCWACRLAPAETIDHDHDHCPGVRACPDCIRGVLCQNCNKAEGHLGHWPEGRDAAFGEYFSLTPLAQKIISEYPKQNKKEIL